MIIHVMVYSMADNYLTLFNGRKMTHTEANYPGTHCNYPGEYIPAPFRLAELLAELQKPHKVNTKPLINVLKMPDAYIVEVAAPGLNSDDFLASIDKNVLSLAVLHKDFEAGKKKYLQHEFNYCCFKRDIVLPGHVDADFLNAIYKNGILRIWLPKSKNPVFNCVERIIIY